MKRFFKGVLLWKNGASLMFTGSVLLYCMISLLYGEAELEISIVFSLLLLSALGTLLQFLAFTEYVIKNVRYSLRLLIFAVPFLILLTGCAYLFRWFPMDLFQSWLIFSGIFLGIFMITSLGFEIYYRISGKKYDGLLGQYKKSRSKNDQKNGL